MPRSFDSAELNASCAGGAGGAGAHARPRRWLGHAARAVRKSLPQACALCVAPAADAQVCPACAATLPWLPPGCPVCALPGTGAAVCGSCLRHPPPFAATIAPFVYGFPVDRLLQQFKYGGRLALADWAAGQLAIAAIAALGARAGAPRPDRIVALPLSAARQRERGFNQAHEIAARVAATLGIVITHSLRRTVAGVPQATLPWSARANNVRGAFACRRDVDGARIALVDDVMTTGATLAAAATALRGGGAARVECWVVARTLPPAAA